MQRPDADQRVLGDRYELRARLGSGGAGTVWRGHDRTLGRAVAIKLLHVDLADDPATESRFRTEATSAAQLTHPNAVQVYDVGRDGSDDYLVMELVEGPSLGIVLRDGPLPAGVAAAVGTRVAAALGAAHEASIVHRDVKPGNVLLTPDGRAKLADFGIARVLGDLSARLTRTGTVLGTARYLAPEQLGEHPIDARADVYALGLVLFEAVTGQPPFGDGSPIEIATRRLTTTLPAVRHLAPEVPEGLDEVIRWATMLEPNDRPGDGRELASALARFAAHDAEAMLARRIEDHLRTARAHEEADPTTARPPGGAPVSPASPVEAPGPDRAPNGGAGTAPDRNGARTHAADPTTKSPAPPPRAGTDVAAHASTEAPNRTAALPAPGPPPPHDGRRRSSVVQWLLVLVIAAGVALAAFVYLGSERGGAGDTPGSAEPPSPDTELSITDISDHDPEGDLREWPDRIGNAIDGDPDTFWPTESYHSADIFGPEKDGVGLWISFEGTATLTDVELDLTGDGGAMELWLGNGAPAEDQLPSEWGERIHEGQIGSADLRIDDLADDVEGDTLLLWFTELPPGGSGYRGEVRNIRVYGG